MARPTGGGADTPTGGAARTRADIGAFIFATAGMQTALNRVSVSNGELGVTNQRLVSAVQQLGAFTAKHVKGYKDVEQQGALYRTSFEENRQASIELRDELKTGVSVYDAFAMGLTATRAGLDSNSAAIQNLMRVASVTGEQFGEMILPLKNLTQGNLRQIGFIEELIHVTNFTATAFQRSTTELISALSVLSKQFLDLVNVGFVSEKVMQEFAFLRGIADLEDNSKRQTKFLEKLLTDPHQASVLGIIAPLNKMIQGDNVQVNMIKALLEGGKNAQNIFDKTFANNVATTNIATKMEERISLLTAITSRNTFLTDAGNKLGMTAKQVAKLSAEEISKKLSEIAMSSAKTNMQWSRTLDVLKREVAAPMVTAMSEIGKKFREMWSSKFGNLWQKVLLTIGQAISMAAGTLADILTVIGDRDLKKSYEDLSAKSIGFYQGLMKVEKNLLAEQKKVAANTKKPPPEINSLWGTVRDQMKLEVRQSKMLIKGIDKLLRAQLRQNELTQNQEYNFNVVGGAGKGTRLGGSRGTKK